MNNQFVRSSHLFKYGTVITNDETKINWNDNIHIAVYVGTFDPPHLNHKMVVDSVLATNFINAVIIVPTYNHCFKNNVSPFLDRFNMLVNMFENTPNVGISQIEKELSELYGTSVNYTYDTLKLLQKQLPNATLHLTIGSDLFKSVDSWYNQDIYLNQNFIVIYRDTYPISMTHNFTAHLLKNNKLIIIGKDFPLPNMNSTSIRLKIVEGKINELTTCLAPSVVNYIYNKPSLLKHYQNTQK
jgi:nicotinate-nucleotide adenylyltransferase